MTPTPVAVVTPGLAGSGGTATMTAFLHRVLSESGRYEPHAISMATSARDSASMQLRRPETWNRGPQVEDVVWNGLPYKHVGAWSTELEICRYRPREVLTRLLDAYPIVQVVAGTAAWARPVMKARGHVCLWAATSVRGDRVSVLREHGGWRKAWASAMTSMAASIERGVVASSIPIFGLSRYTVRALSAMNGRREVVLAPCGVDTALFQPGTPADRPYIVSVGRFSDPRKNLPLLLRAFSRIVRDDSRAPDLWLVGEPPSAAGLQLIGELALGERVRVLGLRRGRELAEIVAGARLFALASDEEGLCIALVEAMAAGLPVVSTRCGGPEDLVEEGLTGRLVGVGDEGGLAAAIQDVLSRPDFMASAGRNARLKAEREFSLRVCGDRFLAHYDSLTC